MLNLVIAHPAEARPIIEHFALEKADTNGPFRILANNRLRLIISGLGKIAAAAAGGYLHHFAGSARHEAWLNVGIAGHADLEVGAIRLAHKVSDVALQRNWYPQRVFPAPCPGEEVRTVDHPEREFADTVVYEMEASGFYATCTHFSTVELIHVLKIISDNRGSPVKR